MEAVEEHRFDALIGGARRDEEKARAKERILSHRDSFGQWQPKNQRPELWTLFNTRLKPGEHMRAFPISNWTELDVWLYIQRERIALPSLYYTHRRDVVRRKGLLVPVTAVTPPAPSETVESVAVRFRTVGDMTCTCPVESLAADAADVVGETLAGDDQRARRDADGRPHVRRVDGAAQEGRLLLMGLALRDDDPAPSARRPLRFLTAGSVDDGKSTLIGRLLLDGRAILADQLDALEAKAGGQPIDLALLTDGLEAEREQGITIDVAYRYFATRERKFIIADAPGHEQYTRNMVTAAAGSDAAVVLVDATKLDLDAPSLAASEPLQLLPQTRRHALLAQLLRVPHIVFAVNKLDAVADASTAFARVRAALVAFAAEAGFVPAGIVPISALHGDNVSRPSALGGYDGPTLLALLEQLPDDDVATSGAALLPVQYVGADAGSGAGHRPRVLWGRVARGEISVGATLEVFPSGETRERQRAVRRRRARRPCRRGPLGGRRPRSPARRLARRLARGARQRRAVGTLSRHARLARHRAGGDRPHATGCATATAGCTAGSRRSSASSTSRRWPRTTRTSSASTRSAR